MFEVIASEEINYRVDFSLLCNARGVRVAVEVGTDQGVFARQFMERFNGESLWCVDNYVAGDEMPGDRLPDLLTAVGALQPWHGRVRFVRLDSLEAAAALPAWVQERIDFVYIDAAHDYQSVAADLAAWWPLVSDGGILAGHDYDPSHPGVIKAVDRFAAKHGLCVRVVPGDHLPSWYVYKTEPAELCHEYFRSDRSPNPRAAGE